MVTLPSTVEDVTETSRRRPSATGANRMRLRLELRADLAALVCGAVHVDVQIAGLECRVLLVVQLRALRHAPLPSAPFSRVMMGGPFLPGAAM